MLSKVRETIKKYRLPVDNSEITVGVSGGADSVALLLVLIELQEEFSYALKVVHVNHNLRGSESVRDENYVKDLCLQLNVPCVVESIEVGKLASERNQSIELCARELRYEAFARHSKGLIATAHNSDDNAETVILNLCRGTGLKGLCGIPPLRDNVIRPLINCSRKDIIAFLESKNQGFVIDSSNESDDYTRNLIRHKIIPVLQGINPSFCETISRMTGILRDDESYIGSIVSDAYTKCVNSSVISSYIESYPDTIRRRVLLHYCKNVGIQPDALHLAEMDMVIEGKKTAVSLPDGLIFHKINSGYIAEPIVSAERYSLKEFSLENDSLPQGSFSCVSKEKFESLKKVNNLLFKFSIDCDKIIGNVTVRSREDGDKYRPVFRNLTKTIRKLLCEEKPSFSQKNMLFIIEDEAGIIFTNLFGIDERVKVSDNSKKIIVYNSADLADF